MVLISWNLQFFVDQLLLFIAPCVKEVRRCRWYYYFANFIFWSFFFCKISYWTAKRMVSVNDHFCKLHIFLWAKSFENLQAPLTSPSPHWTCLWYCRLGTSGWPGFGKISNIKTDLDEDKLKKGVFLLRCQPCPPEVLSSEHSLWK